MTPTPQECTTAVREVSSNLRDDCVVISGMSGLYPNCYHVKDLSELLYNKVNAVTSKPRYNYIHPELAQYTGLVPDLEDFDALLFKVHFYLAHAMDPLARKVLEQVYHAIYDSGTSSDSLKGKKVGVFVGSSLCESENGIYSCGSKNGLYLMGACKTMIANRVSYWLNTKGPSIVLDESCCSSLGALEQAFRAISSGQCEAAIVAGAQLNLYPQTALNYGRILRFSVEGNLRPFDENAEGCVKAEAINALFLQKAKDAKRVYAEVLHVKSEFNHLLEGKIGPKFGFERDPHRIANFLNQFYKEARISPNTVEYVEAFGSAIPEADKNELEVIEEVHCKDRKEPLLVGSVTSNIGYSEAASGISAITKVLLGYHTGKLAANLNCDNPRQDVAAMRDGRMRIVTEHQQFGRTYTAVNGMSFTGLNAHVLLHGHYKPKNLNRYQCSIPYLVTISARHEPAVENIISGLKSRPIDPEEVALLHNLHGIMATDHLGRGYTIIQTNKENQTECLAEMSTFFDYTKRPLWFVYSGMGSQWVGMGTQLMRIPIFASAIERCHKVLQPKGLNIVDIITSSDKTIFDNILHSFVGIAAVQIGLTDILKSIGMEPDMIIGHSVGELGCAYADGCFTAEEMILSAYSRGLVSLQTPLIPGSMAAVGVGFTQISKLLRPEIDVACHNGPESSTISGPAKIMSEFVAELKTRGIFAKEVPCSNIAYHSRYIADAGPGLLKYLKEVIKNPKPRSKRWLSTSVPEDKWSEPIAMTSSAEYHTNNLLNPVHFEEILRLIPANAVLVEIAPHGLLQAILKRSLPESCRHIPLTRRGHADNALFMLDAIGKLYMEGYTPKVHALYPQVEFPVSTGTPMLSHLSELSHDEKWNTPQYGSAQKTTAASCKLIISVHNDEHNYIQGHVVRGKILYPFSAALVAVWDTLAMMQQLPKQQFSVKFTNVLLYAQPVLHDQRLLKLSVSLHKGTGWFEIMDEDRNVATGYVVVLHSTQDSSFKSLLDSKKDSNLDLSSEDIYQSFIEKGYSYSGEFRSIYKANSSLTEAEIVWNNNWVTFLDGLLQLNTIRHDHEGISSPIYIKNIIINTKQHSLELNGVTDKTILKADFTELNGHIRCGGLLVDHVKYKDLPLIKNKYDVALKATEFVPRFESKLDITDTLQVYLQIVAENINKETINVLGIVNSEKDLDNLKEIKYIFDNLSGIEVDFKQVNRDNVSSIHGVDLVVVTNISTDKKLCGLLHRNLQNNTFLINAEESNTKHTPVSALYRIVSSTTNKMKLDLMRWGPTATFTTPVVFTVQQQTDLESLIAMQSSNSQKQNLVVLSSYPPIQGLKEFVKEWRKESKKYQIHMIMTSDEVHFNQLPEFDLAFNVLDSGVWGGYYNVSWQKTVSMQQSITLHGGQVGNLESLHWVEASESMDPGIPITVHYAAINYNDAKRATGAIPFPTNNKDKTFGMDFSGITDSGERVMGVVQSGAVSGRVNARPELLWPVPKHWSLEDAATVPSAYLHAFYCLGINIRFKSGMTVLVHGGTGALGQAVLSIALATRCKVFTTVSDMRKKQFLMRLFPDLNGNHIGNSRDPCFKDLVMNATNGAGCDIVISCVTGALKEASHRCTGQFGEMLDVAQLTNQERYSFGMSNLTIERSYKAINMNSIFNDPKELKYLQELLAEGISRGWVRPLSRVTYAPQDVSRAFRLLAASRHRGRVVLRMRDSVPEILPRFSCSPDRAHLIFCDADPIGLLIADRLIKRGVKNLILHFDKITGHLLLKLRVWKKLGVKLQISSENLTNNNGIVNLLTECTVMGPLEGIYVMATDTSGETGDKLDALVTKLDSVSRKLCPLIKRFLVVNTGNNFGHRTCHLRSRDGLPATVLNVSHLKQDNVLNYEKNTLWYRGAVDSTEQALCSSSLSLSAYPKEVPQPTLLQQILAMAGINISDDTASDASLLDLGLDEAMVPAICSYLTDTHNLSFSEETIPKLTIQQILNLDTYLSEAVAEEVKGLRTFYSYVDSDQLVSTAETVPLPTMTSGTVVDDEFDVTQSYLCIVPGMEGHHERFRNLCMQLKLPALALQPGFDHTNETLKETAQRYAAILLKMKIQKNFYILGYESGVIVALEIANILEEHGFTGTVYCLGGTPEEIQLTLETQLSDFKTEAELQNAVVQHMYTLLSRSTEILEDSLLNAPSWEEKTNMCAKKLLGILPQSVQYTRGLIDAAYTRIQQVRAYKIEPKKLQSQLILIHVTSMSCGLPSDMSPVTLLQRYSRKPVIVHEINAPLAHVARDLRCGAIINKHLDAEILKEFKEKNLLDTYLLCAESFIMNHRG